MSLQDLCRRLVKFKIFLDDNLENERSFSNDQDRSKVSAIPPFRFTEKVIPFWTLKNAETTEVSFVDPDFVIGAKYKNYKEQTIDKCRIINEDNSNIADYEKIGDLPLYVAIEGKNRVRLFQEYRIKIKASVTRISFPPPNELKLHRFRQSNEWFLSCSNDFFVQQENHQILLLYPEITVPLFECYGVKKGKPIRSMFFNNKKRLLKQKELESFRLH